MRISSGGLTDTGRTRGHNEDCFAIDEEVSLYVVADGMGGHTHGEVASKISVDSILQFFADDGAESPFPPDEGLLPHSNTLKAAVGVAQQGVLAAIERDHSLDGMGTTVVGLCIRDAVGAVAHVGDSRVYRLRNGELELLTRDHTWVNEQVMAGYLSEEQARNHPLRNVVTRALGGEEKVVVDVREVPIEVGDLFMLCSDGLSGMIRDSEIKALLEEGKPLQETCQNLIDAANERGGKDNITVVLAVAAAESE